MSGTRLPLVTSDEQRGGLLIAVVSGDRPTLKERATANLLGPLKDLGAQGPVWVVSEDDAASYEEDEHELCVYPQAWAEEYARTHWTDLKPMSEAKRLGPPPGREWACREAERRGCWGVLTLDDNIRRLAVIREGGSAATFILAEQTLGGLYCYADLLAGVALSTNARMVGANLNSVPAMSRSSRVVARVGFPYSLYVERVGPGREEWYGPCEDDIIHAFQYGCRADGATAAIMPFLLYHKENLSKTGLRRHYDSTRSVGLQRMFPEGADVGVRKTHSNGRGNPRVFHTMRRGALRNPLVVQDHELYGAVRANVERIAELWYPAYLDGKRRKAERRSRAAQARLEGSTTGE